jgi:hypothetical protein
VELAQLTFTGTPTLILNAGLTGLSALAASSVTALGSLSVNLGRFFRPNQAFPVLNYNTVAGQFSSALVTLTTQAKSMAQGSDAKLVDEAAGLYEINVPGQWTYSDKRLVFTPDSGFMDQLIAAENGYGPSTGWSTMQTLGVALGSGVTLILIVLALYCRKRKQQKALHNKLSDTSATSSAATTPEQATRKLPSLPPHPLRRVDPMPENNNHEAVEIVQEENEEHSHSLPAAPPVPEESVKSQRVQHNFTTVQLNKISPPPSRPRHVPRQSNALLLQLASVVAKTPEETSDPSWSSQV